jgi:Putative transposase/Transposase zinc-binding domain
MRAAPRPNLEVADIFRGEAASFRSGMGRRMSRAQQRVFAAISACRTAVLGGHVHACDHCDHQVISYNSCRNRHCPKCQALARAEWLERRQAELLPIPYFHLVFTLPAELAALALQNKRLMYGMLFEAASQTIAQVAANPRHLGAEDVGVLAVLHTWGQNLLHHPHLHCVVSGGGLAPDRCSWIASPAYYFLPVRVLSRVFRNKYCQLLRQAYEVGALEFYGALAPLAEPSAFRRWLAAAAAREWIVYAKPPFREPLCVLKYLARYTHRVAISNRRLISYQAGRVTFQYKDYAQGGRTQQMTLAATEFIRRFLLHVLPKGFMRIRHYGYLANRHRQEKLALCRRLLGEQLPVAPPADRELLGDTLAVRTDESEPAVPCPVCQSGLLRIVYRWDRYSPAACQPPSMAAMTTLLPREDSS